MRYGPIFKYKGWDRRVFKRAKGYSGYVNDHHIIPKKFKNHPVIKDVQFDINGNFNLIIMPTPLGKVKLNLDPRYNSQVKSMLDHIKVYYEEYRLWLLVNWLREMSIFLI